ncbi:MAG: hypothetical protein WCA10_04845 [Terracidiphilus sp.]
MVWSLRGYVRDAKSVVALRDELAEEVGGGERVLGVGVNDKGGEAFDRGGGFAVDYCEGDVEDSAIGLAHVVVRDVGGDVKTRSSDANSHYGVTGADALIVG